MNKNRKFPRINLSCDIEYTIDINDTNAQAKDSKTENSKTKDISAGGMCFITYNELPVGTVLNLKFKLNHNENPLLIKGKIAWTEAFNIGGVKGWDNGVEFINLEEKKRYTILNYLESLL